MRIVAGEFRGRPIVAPKGRSTRPTADRVREGLFSALTSRLGADLGGGAILDAFAGSGALGIEALSRGARHATFVEKDATAARTLRTNIGSLGLGDRSTVIQADIRSLSRRGVLPGQSFALLFLDPPYRIGQAEVRALIDALSDTGNLTEGAVVVWEHDSADDADWPPWIEPLFDLQYGSTRVDAGTYSRGDVR